MYLAILHVSMIAVLIIAGTSDYKTRIVKDRYTFIMIALAGLNILLGGQDVVNSILGGLVVFISFMTVGCSKKHGNGIGGADIKLTSALGLYVGFWAIVSIVLLSYFIILIFAMIYKVKVKKSFTHIPYITFLAISVLLIVIIALGIGVFQSLSVLCYVSYNVDALNIGLELTDLGRVIM